MDTEEAGDVGEANVSGWGVLFPGQGSQKVGMGAELFAARPDLLGEPADEVLGWSLRSVVLEGPQSELTRTDRAQPALYALSYALWDELRRGGAPPPDGAAGHSLGELTALAAAGAFGYLDGLALVKARGEAMAAAAAAEPSGMAAVLGVDPETAETIATDRRAAGGRLWVANLNAPGQIVLAGALEDIAWLEENGRALGLRRVIRLDVAGAFHSPLMEPAVERFRAALDAAPIGAPRFPVWSNVTARPIGPDAAPDEVRGALLRQITAPVRFAELLADMARSSITTFVHCGPGDVTASMVRRTVPEAEVLVANDLASVADTARVLRPGSLGTRDVEERP